MNRFSSIDTINRKYRTSQVATLVGGYPSSYIPPTSPALATTPNFSPGTQVIRVQQPPQIIYHQPTPRNIITTHENNMIPNPTLTTNAPNDIPVAIRQFRERELPLRMSQVKSNGCPWWCWVVLGLIGLMVLAGILFGLWGYMKGKNGQMEGRRVNENGNVGKIVGGKGKEDESGELKNQADQDEKHKHPQNTQVKNKEVTHKIIPPIIAPQKPQQDSIQTKSADDSTIKPHQPTPPNTDEPKAETTQPQSKLQPKAEGSSLPKNSTTSETKITKLSCEDGFFQFNGRCLSCPKGSEWNGTNCIRKKPVTTVVESQSDKTEIGAIESETVGKGQEGKSEGEKSSHLYENDVPQDASDDMPDYRANDRSDDGLEARSDGKWSDREDNRQDDSISNVASKAKDGVKSGLSTVGNFASNAWDGTKDMASTAWQGAKNIGRQAQESSPAVAGISQGVRTIADGTKTTARSAWQGAKELGRNAENSDSPAVSGFASGLRSVKDTTGDFLSGAWEGTKNLGRKIFNPHHMMRRYD